jgi:hypothetical protein
MRQNVVILTVGCIDLVSANVGKILPHPIVESHTYRTELHPLSQAKHAPPVYSHNPLYTATLFVYSLDTVYNHKQSHALYVCTVKSHIPYSVTFTPTTKYPAHIHHSQPHPFSLCTVNDPTSIHSKLRLHLVPQPHPLQCAPPPPHLLLWSGFLSCAVHAATSALSTEDGGRFYAEFWQVHIIVWIMAEALQHSAGSRK